MKRGTWGLARLFECIGVMRRGSPEVNIAETGGGERPAQKPLGGEPHERHLLYRIRRPQEKSELLRQDSQRRDYSGRRVGGPAGGAAGLGANATATLAGGDGGDAVQIGRPAG